MVRGSRVFEDLTTSRFNDVIVFFFFSGSKILDENTFVSVFSLENDWKGLHSSLENLKKKKSVQDSNFYVLNLKSVLRSLVLSNTCSINCTRWK